MEQNNKYYILVKPGPSIKVIYRGRVGLRWVEPLVDITVHFGGAQPP